MLAETIFRTPEDNEVNETSLDFANSWLMQLNYYQKVVVLEYRAKLNIEEQIGGKPSERIAEVMLASCRLCKPEICEALEERGYSRRVQ